MNLAERFSEDYCTARKRFRIAAATADWAVESHPIAGVGPHGEKLTIDVAVSPEEDAQRALVLSSGLHGVELPLGSAVQLETLARWREFRSAFPKVRCVLWHGLNPYGAAWSRRWNENNIDLNRNFLLADETFAGAPPGYAALSPLLNPPYSPGWFDFFLTRSALAVLRHGMAPLKQAIAAGQYEVPRGLFFGGHAAAETQRIVAEHLPRHLAGVNQVLHLDFHTGLGPRGVGKLLLESALTESQRSGLETCFGAENFEAATSEGLAYTARGGWGRWCAARQLAPDYLFACAEFGTYAPLAVLHGLRRENQAHHFARPNARATQAASEASPSNAAPITSSSCTSTTPRREGPMLTCTCSSSLWALR